MQLLENLYKWITLQGKVKFEHILFCPTVPITPSGSKGTPDLMVPVTQPRGSEFLNRTTDPDSIATLETQKAFVAKWKELDAFSSAQINALPSVEAAIEYARNLNSGSEEVKDGQTAKKRTHVFITGSIHLVGRALAILEGVDAL